MSVQPPEPSNAEGYCTPQDVVDFFDKYDAFLNRGEVWDDDAGEIVDSGTIDESQIVNDDHIGPTSPTRDQVEARILAASNWIDDFTGHAWRERQVVNEYKSLGGTNYYWRAGTPIKLMKRSIRTPLDPTKGDKIEIWTGDQWEDWVASNEEEGRNGDYWVEDSTGMLYLYRRQLFFRRHKEIRVTYRFGKDVVPQTIQDVAARRTAAHYLESQQYRIITPGNEETPDPATVAEKWREICERNLQTYKEVRTTGNQ